MEFWSVFIQTLIYSSHASETPQPRPSYLPSLTPPLARPLSPTLVGGVSRAKSQI